MNTNDIKEILQILFEEPNDRSQKLSTMSTFFYNMALSLSAEDVAIVKSQLNGSSLSAHMSSWDKTLYQDLDDPRKLLNANDSEIDEFIHAAYRRLLTHLIDLRINAFDSVSKTSKNAKADDSVALNSRERFIAEMMKWPGNDTSPWADLKSKNWYSEWFWNQGFLGDLYDRSRGESRRASRKFAVPFAVTGKEKDSKESFGELFFFQFDVIEQDASGQIWIDPAMPPALFKDSFGEVLTHAPHIACPNDRMTCDIRLGIKYLGDSSSNSHVPSLWDCLKNVEVSMEWSGRSAMAAATVGFANALSPNLTYPDPKVLFLATIDSRSHLGEVDEPSETRVGSGLDMVGGIAHKIEAAANAKIGDEYAIDTIIVTGDNNYATADAVKKRLKVGNRLRILRAEELTS